MQDDLQRYRFIAENSLDLICEATLDGFYTYLSASYRDVLGYEPEELLGRHFAELLHPNDREAVLAAFNRHSGDLTPGRATFRYRHKDGSWRWLETLGKPSAYPGDVLRAVFVSRDITERKEAEASLHRMEDRLMMVVNHSPVILCATNAEGVVTLLEGQGLNGIGLTAGQVVGKSIFDVYQNQPETLAIINRALAGETLSTTVEMEGRIFEAYFTPAYDEAKAISGMASVSIDVTESWKVRRELDEELLKRSKLESLAVLAGGIAHDFNNLLTAVLGNLSLAQLEANPDSTLAESLAEAESACMRTRDMVAELSTFARGGAPVKKRVCPEHCIRQAVLAAMRGADVTCDISVEPGLLPIAADESQIKQVLQNLLVNARQAMPGGGTIQIDARNTDAPESLPAGRYIIIRVTDYGSGIRKEHLSRIFEPYFTTKKGGHGIGLATAHSIVANHGGALLAESVEGAGAILTMYLPARADEVAELEVAGLGLQSGRILVMDDEETICDLAERMLAGVGFQVETVTEGAQAVRQYREALEAGNPYDAVVLDLTVPMGIGGFEAFQAIREINPEVKAIISSGYSEDPIMANYQEHGIAAVVPKPYKAMELLDAVRQTVRSETN